jgi:hypothetical protein
MKTFNLFVSVIGIIIGMTITANSTNPEKDKTGKISPDLSKINLNIRDNKSNALPPPQYHIDVTITDPEAECAAKSCTLWIIVQPANSSCEAVSQILDYEVYNPQITDYDLDFDTDATYVLVNLVDVPGGSCRSGYNSNSCCYLVANLPATCQLAICP